MVTINGIAISGKFNEAVIVPSTKYQILYPNGDYYEGHLNA